MIKFYVNVNQLINFVDNREPVRFIPQVIGEEYVEMCYKEKDIILKRYNSYITIELRKKRNKLWQKIKSIHKKN